MGLFSSDLVLVLVLVLGVGGGVMASVLVVIVAVLVKHVGIFVFGKVCRVAGRKEKSCV